MTKKVENKAYVYILKCKDDTLYTGWTNNLENRVINHNTKKGAKYTKNRLPAYLVYFETAKDKSEAMKREFAIKLLNKSQKNDIISNMKSKNKKTIDDINAKVEKIFKF